MDSPVELLHHHKKNTHVKRSIGKHPHPVDSPTYDASEEDNDPTTDDAASVASFPITRPSRHTSTPSHVSKSSTSRSRHQLASSLLSDDGTDSQTYDGDVESSATAGPDNHSTHSNFLRYSSSVSTLTSPAEDLPSPVVSPASLPPSSAGRRAASADRRLAPHEPKPASISEQAFNPAALTPDDIQAFVRRAIDGEPGRSYSINEPPTDRPVRIFADGVYDLFHFGHALQLRQAKLSFSNVHVLAGVNTTEDVELHKARCVMTHAERCEAVRHCRWVDEVIPDSPWILTAEFLEKHKIDYVAHDEVPYASEGLNDVYQFIKERGQFLPTRRTPGVSTSELLERIVTGYRKRDFDKKLEKMGHAELKAEGSDFEDKSTRNSRANSPQRQ